MGPKEEEALQKQTEAKLTMTNERRKHLNQLRRTREQTMAERQIRPMSAREERESYRSWGCLIWQFIIGIAFVALPIIAIYYLGNIRRGSKGPAAAIFVGGVILIMVACRVIGKIFGSISNAPSQTENRQDRK